MIGQREFLQQLLQQLEQSGITSMISGSVASSFHGAPRATRDADLVIDCAPDQLASFLRAVHRLDWYVSDDAAVAALNSRTMFNVIDPVSGWKADLIVRKLRHFSKCEFDRRIEVHVFGPDSAPVAVTTPEDTILTKLEWAQHAHSEQQYRDALAVAVFGAEQLDRAYLRRWAADLGIAAALDQLLTEADAQLG